MYHIRIFKVKALQPIQIIVYVCKLKGKQKLREVIYKIK